MYVYKATANVYKKTNGEIQNHNNSVFDRYSEHNTLKKGDYYNYHLNTDQYLIKGSL